MEVLNPGAVVAHLHREALRAVARALDGKADPPPASVFVCVAGELRHRRGEPRLVLTVEAQELGDLPRALPREHDVVLVAELDGQQRQLR